MSESTAPSSRFPLPRVPRVLLLEPARAAWWGAITTGTTAVAALMVGRATGPVAAGVVVAATLAGAGLGWRRGSATRTRRREARRAERRVLAAVAGDLRVLRDALASVAADGSAPDRATPRAHPLARDVAAVHEALADASATLRSRLDDADAATMAAAELVERHRAFATAEREALGQVAALDLTQGDGGAAGDVPDDEALAGLAAARGDAVAALAGHLLEVRATAARVQAASATIGDVTEQLAVSASAQRAATEDAAESLRRVSASSARYADQAQEIDAAIQAASTGVERVYALRQVVDDMRESSTATARIVRTISDIALQIRLLSLNAAVEAARAGDAGGAFGVVAEEMRRLAQRSADAAAETATLVESAVRAAGNGSAVDVEGLGRSVAQIATVMTSVAQSSAEQRGHLDEISAMMGHLAELMPRTADQAMAAAEAGAELADGTAALWRAQARIRLPEPQFAASVASAAPAAVVTSAPAPAPAVAPAAAGEAFTLRFLDGPLAVAAPAASAPAANAPAAGLALQFLPDAAPAPAAPPVEVAAGGLALAWLEAPEG